MTAGGHVFFPDRVAPLHDQGTFQWIAMLRDRGAICVPRKAQVQLIEELYQSPSLPKLNLPPELKLQEEQREMRPRLKLSEAKSYRASLRTQKVRGRLLIAK